MPMPRPRGRYVTGRGCALSGVGARAVVTAVLDRELDTAALETLAEAAADDDGVTLSSVICSAAGVDADSVITTCLTSSCDGASDDEVGSVGAGDDEVGCVGASDDEVVCAGAGDDEVGSADKALTSSDEL